MPAAAVVTLVAVALVVVALATYLVWAALLLRHVSSTLGTIVAGLRAIAHRTEPLGGTLGGILQDLEHATADLEQVLHRVEPEGRPDRQATGAQ